MASSDDHVIAVHTIDEWTRQLEKANESRKLMVVDFTASWCGPCRFIAPILAEIARKTPEAIFVKVDVDELKSVSEDWAVEAMPTFVLVKEGNILDRIVGAKKDELQMAITKHATPVAVTSNTLTSPI